MTTDEFATAVDNLGRSIARFLGHDCKPEPYVPIIRGERFDYAAISPTFWRCYLCREPMYGVPK